MISTTNPLHPCPGGFMMTLQLPLLPAFGCAAPTGPSPGPAPCFPQRGGFGLPDNGEFEEPLEPSDHRAQRRLIHDGTPHVD